MAGLLAAPVLIAAVWLTGIEGYRLMRPGSSVFSRDEALASLADAITVCCRVEDAHAFIRAGQDPNEAIVIDKPEYTGGGSMTVSPLMLAVAAGNGNAVMMLLGAGAQPSRPENRFAGCLARELGQDEMTAIVTRFFGEAAGTACPAWSPDDTRPLLRRVVSGPPAS